MLIHVAGLPQQQGSKNPWGGEANKKLGPWRGHVTQVAEETWGGRPLLLGPVELRVTFAFPRPASHYGTGRNAGVLKANAPYYKQSAPDLDKLQRAIGDALSATIFRDDAQVAVWNVRKVYADTAYAEIEIHDLSGGSDDDPGRAIPIVAGQDPRRQDRSTSAGSTGGS